MHEMKQENENRVEQFKTIFDSAIDGVFEANFSGEVTAVNLRLADLLGYTTDEMIGKNVTEFISNEEILRGRRDIELFKKRPFNWISEWCLKRKCGAQIYTEISGSIASENSTRAFVRDISWRNRHEKQNAFLIKLVENLHQKPDYKERIHEIANSVVPSLVDFCIISFRESDRLVLEAVKVAQKVELTHLKKVLEHFGSQQDGFYRKPLLRSEKTEITFIEDVETELQKKYSRVPEHLKRHLQKFSISSYLSIPFNGVKNNIGELTFCTTGGQTKICAEDLPFFNSLSALCGAEIENAKTHFDTQKQIRDRERLLLVVSHDLRNPLAVIEASAEMLMFEGYQRGFCKETVIQRMLRATSAMDKLISDLLDFSKVRSETFKIDRKPVHIKFLVYNAVEAFTKEMKNKEQILVLRCDEFPDVCGDERRLTQVVWNLIGNAVKYTPQKGMIEVSVDKVGSKIQISVKDSGPGLSNEDLPKVFDQFWQCDKSSLGVGLGLAIAKEIVSAHDGEIWVESKFGFGCRFVFTIPIFQDL